MSIIRDDALRHVKAVGGSDGLRLRVRNHIQGTPEQLFYLTAENSDFELLAQELNKIEGFFATYTPPEPPKPALPTVQGIYVAANLNSDNLQGAQIYKLKSSTWTDADGYPVSEEVVQRMSDASGGLKRLILEGE